MIFMLFLAGKALTTEWVVAGLRPDRFGKTCQVWVAGMGERALGVGYKANALWRGLEGRPHSRVGAFVLP